jgi:DNA-binding NarL/FixJ family response regulator/tetratricopeptide (TPR) repeat protein
LVGIDVPPGVAAALTEELALLAGVSRRILEGAAVAGDPFDPELAAAAAGLDETLALDAVDDLLRLDLIRPTDVPRRFRFRHPLVRRAIYEAAPAGWRLGAHERAAGALAVRGASAEERAHHVERAGRQGETEAISVLREAGSTAAHRAPASAAQWLAAAIRLLPSDFPPGERVELRLACAEAQARSGRLEAGHMTLVRALETVPEGSVALHVRVTNACAGLEHLLGHHERAHKRLETALAEVADQHSPDTVALMIELVLDALYRSAFQEMRSWAERAVAAEIHDLPLRAAALAVRAMAAAMGASADEARICCDEAAKAVDALSDAEIATRLNALAHLATAEVYTERFVLSIRHAERALRVGRATGQLDLTPLITPNLSCAYWVQGRMAEAADLLDGAVESERMLGNTQGLVWKLYNRSFAAFAAGDIDLALATANESFELAKQVDESIITGHAAWMVAQAVLETGQADEAAYLLLSASGGEEQTVIPGAWRAAALELLTRALVTAGRRDEARRSAAAAAAWASSIGLSMAAALARLAEATIELDDGNATGAARLALEAAATFEEIGNRYHAALSRRFAGRALVQAGAPDEAAAELERAARAFESFGAHRYHSELEQELRKLGRTIHHRSAAPTSDSGLDSLTARERELARLVVDRKTNPEIARELFLSPKTVETHLRNIFRKLGVANRVELARAVEQHERAAPR